jgi:hypothetical protein
MRLSLALAVVASLGVFGCERRTPPPPTAPSAARLEAAPAAQSGQPTTVHGHDSGAGPPAPLATGETGLEDGGHRDADPALESSLEQFAGFSADESQFAFAVFSEGAGFSLLYVLSGHRGAQLRRFELSDPDRVEEARAFLRGAGFTTRRGLLATGTRVVARVEGNRVVVEHRLGDTSQVLYREDPFKYPEPGAGGPARAEVWGASPSGKKVAVRVEQVPVTEFGGTTTYLVLSLPQGGK